MNAKLLYATTIALALASSFAWADDSRPLSRAEVVAEFNAAAANGTLRKNDYDYDAHDFVAGPTRARAHVIAELARARTDRTLIGPLRNKTYNPFGTELLRTSDLARADVRAEVLAARHDGTLRRTDYDDEPSRTARGFGNRAGRPILATAPKTPRVGS